METKLHKGSSLQNLIGSNYPDETHQPQTSSTRTWNEKTCTNGGSFNPDKATTKHVNQNTSFKHKKKISNRQLTVVIPKANTPPNYNDRFLNNIAIGDIENIKQLLNFIDINYQDENGNTALHIAFNNTDTMVIKLLLEAGANPFIKNKKMDSVFRLACVNQNLHLAQLFSIHNTVNRGNLTKYINMLSHIICETGATNILDFFLTNKLIDIEKKDNNGMTPLHVAINNRHHDTITYLLNNGADINSTDDRGNNALCFAVLSGEMREVQRFLKNYNMDIEFKNKFDETPLLLASDAMLNDEISFEHIAKYLIHQGANIEARDKEGNTAIILAAMRHDYPLLEVLVNYSDINAQNNYRETALHVVASSGTMQEICLLIKNHAQICRKTASGNTVLSSFLDRLYIKTINYDYSLNNDLSSFNLSDNYSFEDFKSIFIKDWLKSLNEIQKLNNPSYIEEISSKGDFQRIHNLINTSNKFIEIKKILQKNKKLNKLFNDNIPKNRFTFKKSIFKCVNSN